MRGRPYSLRLKEPTLRALAEEAGRLRLAPRTLAQELVEEGLRVRRHPTIAFVDRAAGRRAAVARRPRLSVAQVIQTVRASTDLREAGEYLDLTVTEIERILDYYAEFREEIDTEIERRMEIADREERLFRERERLVSR